MDIPPSAPAAPRFQRPPDYWALWAVALVSLALNALLLYEQAALLGAARAQAPAVAQAAAEIGALRAGAFDYTVRVDKTVPVITNIPLQQSVTVPLSATLPINTEVEIPISFAGFSQTLRVPVHAQVPVQLTTEVPLALTVPVHADVPVQFDVPVHIAVAGTPLAASLARAETALTDLSTTLAQVDLGWLWARLFGGVP